MQTSQHLERKDCYTKIAGGRDDEKLTSHPLSTGAGKIVFFHHHRMEVPSLLDYGAKPDIVGTEATVFGEYHKGHGARTNLQIHRGFLGIMSEQSSRLSRTRSMSMWEASILNQFVESLYRGLRGHRDAHDQTIGLDLSHAEGRVFVPDNPHWRFSMLPACSFRVIFVAPAHSRGTRIFNSRIIEMSRRPLIIKEVYVPDSGRWYEAEMLKRLHSTGQNGPLQVCLRAMEPEPRPTVRTLQWPDQEARQPDKNEGCFASTQGRSPYEAAMSFNSSKRLLITENVSNS